MLSPIACELCRNKKCKCDRETPFCSQCVAAGVTCYYRQSNKRGIPTGYIASLEKRLLATEIALFNALSYLHPPQDSEELVPDPIQVVAKLTQLDFNQSKASRVDEWRRLPLKSTDQQKAWWNDRLRALNEVTQQKDFALQEQDVQDESSSMVEPNTIDESPSTETLEIEDAIIVDQQQDHAPRQQRLMYSQSPFPSDPWTGPAQPDAPFVTGSSHTVESVVNSFPSNIQQPHTSDIRGATAGPPVESSNSCQMNPPASPAVTGVSQQAWRTSESKRWQKYF